MEQLTPDNVTHTVPTIDAQWFANYCGLELECEHPILEAVGVYWKWIKTSIRHFEFFPPIFPWKKYQDVSLYLCILRTHGIELRNISRELQAQHPQLVWAAINNNGDALVYAHYRTPELCLAAVTKDGRALRHIREEEFPEHYESFCVAAVLQTPVAYQYVMKVTPAVLEAMPPHQ